MTRSLVEPYFKKLSRFENVCFWLLPRAISGLAAVPVLVKNPVKNVVLQFPSAMSRFSFASLSLSLQAHGDFDANRGLADHHGG